jgi:hypothetical protein
MSYYFNSSIDKALLPYIVCLAPFDFLFPGSSSLTNGSKAPVPASKPVKNGHSVMLNIHRLCNTFNVTLLERFSQAETSEIISSHIIKLRDETCLSGYKNI